MARQYSTLKLDKLIHRGIKEELDAEGKYSIMDLNNLELLKLKYKKALKLLLEGMK